MSGREEKREDEDLSRKEQVSCSFYTILYKGGVPPFTNARSIAYCFLLVFPCCCHPHTLVQQRYRFSKSLSLHQLNTKYKCRVEGGHVV